MIMNATHSQTLIPSVLHGTYREVVKSWRGIARQAIRDESWGAVLKTLDWIDIRNTTELIILDGPRPWNTGCNVQMYPVVNEFMNELHKSKFISVEVTQKRFRTFYLEAMPSFWFCLALLADPGPVETGGDGMSLLILKSLLKWWPDFCQLESRFKGMLFYDITPPLWKQWSIGPVSLCNKLGWPDEDLDRLKDADSSRAAGEIIRDRVT